MFTTLPASLGDRRARGALTDLPAAAARSRLAPRAPGPQARRIMLLGSMLFDAGHTDDPRPGTWVTTSTCSPRPRWPSSASTNLRSRERCCRRGRSRNCEPSRDLCESDRFTQFDEARHTRRSAAMADTDQDLIYVRERRLPYETFDADNHLYENTGRAHQVPAQGVQGRHPLHRGRRPDQAGDPRPHQPVHPEPHLRTVAQPGAWGNNAANKGEGGKSMRDGVKPQRDARASTRSSTPSRAWRS